MYNYLISSDDTEALNNKIEEIYKSFNLEFDVTRYDLEEDNIYNIIDELSTISLFDNPKFVIAKALGKLALASERQINELLMVMNNKDSNNVLVLTCLDKIDFKNDNLAKVRKYSVYFDIRIKNIPLDTYAHDYLLKNGYTIDSQALSELVKYSVNLATLRNNLDILISFKDENKRIEEKDVSKMIKQPLEDNIFQLIDMVLAKNKKAVFKMYNDFRIENIPPTYIISMLINKFQEMYDVYHLAKGGADQQSIMDLYNVSSGKAYYMLKNSKAASLDEIKNNLNELMDLDYKIKSGKVDQYLGLELYLLR
jgi:DNA polymerase-3 subunit delta